MSRRKAAKGLIDSQGQFTLDRDNARRLLSQYQLPDPWAYILKLVQWAVASAPSRVDVDVRRGRVAVSHDGSGVPADNLEQGLLDPLRSSSRSLAHLSIGLNSALNLEPKGITLESLGQRTSLLGNLLQETNELETGWSRLAIQGIRRRRLLEGSSLVRSYTRQFQRWTDFEGPIQSLVWDAAGCSLPEVGLIRQLAYLSSVPIILNGSPVNRPFLGGPLKYSNRGGVLKMWPRSDKGAYRARFLLNPTWSPSSLAAPTTAFCTAETDWLRTEHPSRDAQGSERVEASRAGSVWLAFATAGLASFLVVPRGRGNPAVLPVDDCSLAPNLEFRDCPVISASAAFMRYPMQYGSAEGKLGWVLDGVIVEHSTMPRLKKNTVLFADADGLRTDLSSLSLVRDEAFESRVSWLAHWCP